MRKPESVANFLVPKNSLLSSAISTTRKQQPYSPIYRNSAFYERYFDSVHQPEHPEQRGFQLSPKMVDMPLHIASKSRLAMR